MKYLVDADHLLVANGRFEGTSWVATAAGPPLGGVLIGLLGPVIAMPMSWTDDRARCQAAGIPDTVEFQTKPRLGRGMLARALAAGVPYG